MPSALRLRFLIVLPLALGCMVQSAVALNGRIAISHDGNRHDIDDWAAASGNMLILQKAGLIGKLAHFQHSNHISGSNEAHAVQKKVVDDGVKVYGIPSSVVFDCMQNLKGATEHLAAAIDASSATDSLYIICAGPMETVWRAVNASKPEKRKFVRAVSHSQWNNNHPFESTGKADCKLELKHKFDDIGKLGVQLTKISDQNRQPWMKANVMNDPQSIEYYAWMKNHPDEGIAYHYTILKKVADGYKTYSAPYRADWSDSGMLYWLITGKQSGVSMDELKVFLTQTPTTGSKALPALRRGKHPMSYALTLQPLFYFGSQGADAQGRTIQE